MEWNLKIAMGFLNKKIINNLVSQEILTKEILSINRKLVEIGHSLWQERNRRNIFLLKNSKWIYLINGRGNTVFR